jgi:hypothetical protein
MPIWEVELQLDKVVERGDRALENLTTAESTIQMLLEEAAEADVCAGRQDELMAELAIASTNRAHMQGRMRARVADQLMARNALLIRIDASEQARRDGIAETARLASIENYQRETLNQIRTKNRSLRGELETARKRGNGREGG